MRDAIKTANKCAVTLSAIVLGCLTLVLVLDIFLRNVFLVFIPGVFDFTQFFLPIAVFFALANVNDKKEYMVASALYKVFPNAGKWVLSLIGSLLVFVIGLIVTLVILLFAISSIDGGFYTLSLRVPLWISAMIVSAGMFLFCLSALSDVIFIIKDKGVL